MRPIIRVEGLSKRYHINTTAGSYRLLRDSLSAAWRAPLGRLFGTTRGDSRKSLWALDDVSFEVAPGEVLGVIGRNGAGKSTLLKILTRITEPTRGRAELYGRVGSLLEVGTGFHGELTGRENVFLNGAILGIRRRDIERRFDAIVSFADVEAFLETPVKFYSSGMYMRLAFSVAAHMEPDILLVDEVLAVGDAAFQRKCLRKMRSVAGEGRTVLFVSHNLEAIKALCSRCLLLEGGRIVADGAPVDTIERSLELQGGPVVSGHVVHRDSGTDAAAPLSIDARAAGKSPDEPITFDDEIVVTLRLDGPLAEGNTFAFQVVTGTGVVILESLHVDDPRNPPLRPGATRGVSVRLPARLLPGGAYEAAFTCLSSSAEVLWVAREAWFDVHDVRAERTDGPGGKRSGIVSMTLSWDSHANETDGDD